MDYKTAWERLRDRVRNEKMECVASHDPWFTPLAWVTQQMDDLNPADAPAAEDDMIVLKELAKNLNSTMAVLVEATEEVMYFCSKQPGTGGEDRERLNVLRGKLVKAWRWDLRK